MRICHFCQAEVADKAFCPVCTADFPHRPDPFTLTPDERETEMRSIGGPCEVPFSLIHKRIEDLVGRPVWTHEMGLNWEGLCKEAHWEDRPATIEEIISLIPKEKRIVIDGGAA